LSHLALPHDDIWIYCSISVCLDWKESQCSNFDPPYVIISISMAIYTKQFLLMLLCQQEWMSIYECLSILTTLVVTTLHNDHVQAFLSIWI
jgi:hypothetical protein